MSCSHASNLSLIDRAIERNLTLKIKETWLETPERHFLRLPLRERQVRAGRNDRKAAIREAPLPRTKKALQSFHGSALFFRSFVPHDSTLTDGTTA